MVGRWLQYMSFDLSLCRKMQVWCIDVVIELEVRLIIFYFAVYRPWHSLLEGRSVSFFDREMLTCASSVSTYCISGSSTSKGVIETNSKYWKLKGVIQSYGSKDAGNILKSCLVRQVYLSAKGTWILAALRSHSVDRYWVRITGRHRREQSGTQLHDDVSLAWYRVWSRNGVGRLVGKQELQ